VKEDNFAAATRNREGLAAIGARSVAAANRAAGSSASLSTHPFLLRYHAALLTNASDVLMYRLYYSDGDNRAWRCRKERRRCSTRCAS